MMDSTPRTERMRELEDDVRVARGDLASTVDELTGWFDPRTRVDSAVDKGRRLVSEATGHGSDPEERARARILLGVAAAAAAAVVAGIVGRINRR
jgi:hypothetical protein